MTTSSAISPVPGMGATWHFPNPEAKLDYMTAKPMVITHVSKTGKTIRLESLKVISEFTGHSPLVVVDDKKIWRHVYTSEEIRKFSFVHPLTYSARLNEFGEWMLIKHKKKLTIGAAIYYMEESIKS